MQNLELTDAAREVKETSKYCFSWCKDCGGLKQCYYQHGEYSKHPFLLDPDCAKGPLP